jgi:hypothetical protein
MNDHEAALAEIRHDIGRLRTNLDSLCLRDDLSNKELIDWAFHLVDVIEDCVEKGLGK